MGCILLDVERKFRLPIGNAFWWKPVGHPAAEVVRSLL